VARDLGEGRTAWGAALSLAGIVLITYVAVMAGARRSAWRIPVESDLQLLNAILVASAMGIAAWRCRRIDARLAHSWAALCLAFVAYAVGDVLWVVMGTTLGGAPLSPEMNAAYLLFYPLFLWGVISLPEQPLGRIEKVALVVDMSVVMLAAAMLVWSLLIGPALGTAGHPLPTLLTLLAYPTCDLALLWAAMTLLFRRPGVATRLIYRMLAASAAVLIAADVLYVHQILSGNEGLGEWTGLGWTASFLLAGLAATRQATTSASLERHDGEREPRAHPETAALYLAYASLAVALLVVLAGQMVRLGRAPLVVLAAMFGLVVVRQLLALNENTRLYRSLRDARDDLEARVEERTGQLAGANVELRLRVRELTVLNAVGEIAADAQDEGSLVARTTAVIRDTLFPDNCGLLLVDEAAGVLRHAPSYHSRALRAGSPAIPLGEGITGKVAVSGVARRVACVAEEPDYIAVDSAMRSELCVALRVGQRVLGVIDVESEKEDAFTESDERLLGTLASQVAPAIEQLRAAAALRDSEERFRRLSESAFEGIAISQERIILDANSRLAEILDCNAEDLLGHDLLEFVAADSRERVAQHLLNGSQEPYEYLARRGDGSIFPVEVRGRTMPGDGGTWRVTALRDISERKSAEARISSQLQRLAALHEIDAAIAKSVDLQATLELLLEHVVGLLGVDAVDVLLPEGSGATLRCVAARGLRDGASGRGRVSVPETLAGQAVRDRCLVSVPDLGEAPDSLMPPHSLPPEGFVAYCAAPFVTNDRVNGVLEIFHRTPWSPDREWFDFLETLSGQMAIAIDNRSLLEGLQRSATEIAAAYDSTLEGWSRALELRDRETQGHTHRVVEMTVRLARAVGIDEAELVDVRRGALLHDIGKMGVPDSILLKPSELSSEEQEIMRRHPVHAFNLLSPIAYLRPALDIPYAHHERWDGSGYPLGLEGEEIPIAARVFAVVDTWDALTHDRPYRAAWSGERARDYIRDHSGTSFDPRVVDAFLELAVQP
jgi:PAS domain S-box-containing protein